MTFIDYIKDVKSQLYCNATEEFKNNYITYIYTNEDIDNNMSFFRKSFDLNLSAYKALLYFIDEIKL